MPVLRSKSLTAKVTADEYELFAAHAGERTISEWARDVLLQAISNDSAKRVDERDKVSSSFKIRRKSRAQTRCASGPEIESSFAR